MQSAGVRHFPLVWFKIKGYPHWPGVRVSLDDLSAHQLEVRPGIR